MPTKPKRPAKSSKTSSSKTVAKPAAKKKPVKAKATTKAAAKKPRATPLVKKAQGLVETVKGGLEHGYEAVVDLVKKAKRPARRR